MVPEKPASYELGCCCITCRVWTTHLIATGVILRYSDLKGAMQTTKDGIWANGLVAKKAAAAGDEEEIVEEFVIDPNIPWNCMLCSAIVKFGSRDDPHRFEEVCKNCKGITSARVMEHDIDYVELEDSPISDEFLTPEQRSQQIRRERMHQSRRLRLQIPYFEDRGDGRCEYCTNTEAACGCALRCEACESYSRNCNCQLGIEPDSIFVSAVTSGERVIRFSPPPEDFGEDDIDPEDWDGDEL